MPVKRIYLLFLMVCFLVGPLLACSALPTVTFQGTPSATLSSGYPSGQGTPSLNQWIKAAPGVELRYEHWESPGDNQDTVTIARFDLRYVHLSIGYQPTNSPLLDGWMKQFHALAVINGGYFDAQNNPEGLLVSNGRSFGTSYTGFGGMLSVDAQGHLSLRSLRDQPYDPDTEQLEQATQSSPMLIIGGKRTQFSANAASERRSVVAMDRQGRLLLIVSPNAAFSLDELADLLASSDLSLETALNLDGGTSTGLYVDAGSQKVSIDSITALPIAIILK